MRSRGRPAAVRPAARTWLACTAACIVFAAPAAGEPTALPVPSPAPAARDCDEAKRQLAAYRNQVANYLTISRRIGAEQWMYLELPEGLPKGQVLLPPPASPTEVKLMFAMAINQGTMSPEQAQGAIRALQDEAKAFLNNTLRPELAASEAKKQHLEAEVEKLCAEDRVIDDLDQPDGRPGQPGVQLGNEPGVNLDDLSPASLAAFRGGLRGSWEITCFRGERKLEFKDWGVWYLEFAGNGTVSGRFENSQGSPRPVSGGTIKDSGFAQGEAVTLRWSGTFQRDGNSLALTGGRGSLNYTEAVLAEPGLTCNPGSWRKD